jgi:xanthosine utilization system XapX-like protein
MVLAKVENHYSRNNILSSGPEIGVILVVAHHTICKSLIFVIHWVGQLVNPYNYPQNVISLVIVATVHMDIVHYSCYQTLKLAVTVVVGVIFDYINYQILGPPVTVVNVVMGCYINGRTLRTLVSVGAQEVFDHNDHQVLWGNIGI